MKWKIKVYKPRASIGWFSNGMGILIMGLLLTYTINPIIKEGAPPISIITLSFPIIILIAFTIIASIFLSWYPTMRYELSEDKLILRCGPLKSEIPLTSIKEIRKKNLKYHPSSTGWKLPGYCIFRIKYADEDWVRMYSRAMLRNIIIIETDKEKYGITPREEEFLAEISEKTGIRPKIEISAKRKSKNVLKFEGFLISFKKKINLELISISVILFIIIINIIYYPQLPSKIPVHFNLKGVPDDLGLKSMIFILPGVMVLIYLLTFTINALAFLDDTKMYFSLWFLSLALLILLGCINIGTLLTAFGKINNLYKAIGIPLIILLFADFQFVITVIRERILKNKF